jgi:hypothetical protein
VTHDAVADVDVVLPLATETGAAILTHPVPIKPQEGSSDDKDGFIYDNDDDDDDISVTSDEIKDILTNIKDDTVDDVLVTETLNQEQQVVSKEPIIVTPQVPLSDGADFSSLTEAELNAHKYDDIRNYLRRCGISAKGTKQSYIQRILEMQKEATL